MHFKLTLVAFAALLVAVTQAEVKAQQHAIEFNRDIRPILSDKCFACHGTDAKTRQADLRLDNDSSTKPSGSSEAAIIPGQPHKSPLILRILSQDADQKMPPASSHKRVTEREVQLLTQWISEGAKYQLHWAFEPPKLVEPTSQPASPHILNPIDAYIQARSNRLISALRNSPTKQL